MSHLHADTTFITCPTPNQINTTKNGNTYTWTAPNVPPAGWLGSGGSKAGNWENVTLTYYANLQNTVILCHYQSDKGGPSQGSINPMVGGICYFKNGANPFESGSAQCTGKSPNDCQVECIPYSETPKVSGSCVGHRVDYDPGETYNCFSSFKDTHILSPKVIGVESYYNCGGGNNTATITVSDAPVCLKYSSDRNDSISFNWDNNKLFSPGTYNLNFYASWCPSTLR